MPRSAEPALMASSTMMMRLSRTRPRNSAGNSYLMGNNPVLAAGQIEGGIAQAIGMTLYENVVWENGRMMNGQMTNYIMPTAADVPPIRVYFEENSYAFGPAGAKGIGELPMDGPAPAILNAIENATGESFNCIPLMPETMMQESG